jgi:hypothetical protein
VAGIELTLETYSLMQARSIGNLFNDSDFAILSVEVITGDILTGF